SRPSRSSSRSTSAALRCTPARRAQARRSNRRPSSLPWVSTPTARCAPASAGRRPTPTSTRSSTRCRSSSNRRADSVVKLRRMPPPDWPALAGELTDALHLSAAPLAITFSDAPLPGVAMFDEPMPAPLPDGRTGRVPAGCVFWMKAADRTFGTVAEDHGNCSVGSMTHGFKTLEEVAANGDVAALLESGWVTMDMVPHIPVVTERPATVPYG